LFLTPFHLPDLLPNSAIQLGVKPDLAGAYRSLDLLYEFLDLGSLLLCRLLAH
jgi:hypothetical protein